ncbi:putative aminotransferase [Campylobacter sputorum subsp. sputorum]|uniref:Putative aminotransferase n=1 Tax=Campylobacter sputorum subsp. sputorum TaxID=32024 RepID=A0A381F3E8_9BACT|nr:putative aminotransferase [Campylobacter sputorum subsp. sputorum]
MLIIKKELCKSNLPTFAGGGTVSYVSRISQSFIHDKEQLEQGGTPGIIQLIRVILLIG